MHPKYWKRHFLPHQDGRPNGKRPYNAYTWWSVPTIPYNILLIGSIVTRPLDANLRSSFILRIRGNNSAGIGLHDWNNCFIVISASIRTFWSCLTQTGCGLNVKNLNASSHASAGQTGAIVFEKHGDAISIASIPWNTHPSCSPKHSLKQLVK